jgi:hypothetical protein
MGLEKIPVIRLDLDPDEPRALKVLTGDNEIANLVQVDDRALTELLKEIKDTAVDGLLGTGFSDQSLAALVMVTRPASEIEDFDAAAEWVGMPEFDPGTKAVYMTINFRSVEDRSAFVEKIGLDEDEMRKYKDRNHITTWWPPREANDLSALRFEETQGAGAS